MSAVEAPSIEAIDEELRLRSLADFVPTVTPKYMRPTHLEPLLLAFERAVEGIPQRVCCSAPPRHAKTESVLHVPAFTLRRYPEKTLSYSTYGDRFARKGSRKARQLVRSIGIEVTGSVNEWRTAEGGGVVAGGVGGPLIGQGVDIAIIDDPVKNRAEAESETYRNRLVDWMHDVLISRIEPGGSIFCFMQRWHPNDLIGSLVEEGFELIQLPAIDPAGNALWPERWPIEALRKREEEVGEYTWASLYQGNPRPRGAAVFNGCHIYTTPPTTFRTAGGMDSAYSEKKTADYSAYVKMRRQGDKYYVVDAKRVREPAPMFKARLSTVHEPGMQWRWYVATSELGAAALFGGEGGVPVRGMVAKADKFIRALQYAAAWNRGDVLVPKSAPWLDDFLSEHASFTGIKDKRDDLIDAAVAAFDALAVSGEGGGAAPVPQDFNSMKGM